MGRWNTRQDKEPSKKDEVAYKEFLIAKYERKQWYRNHADVRKEREPDNGAPAPEPKLLPPPSTKVCVRVPLSPHIFTLHARTMYMYMYMYCDWLSMAVQCNGL